ncbi:hypothetical protein K1Y78_28055 [Streptomyces sp. tea 10]|nr:hypothetical protein [Streptomyces sp. tea 10]
MGTIGRYLATEAFPATPEGYRSLLAWLRSHGHVLTVRMEGTGSFGAELARYLRANQITVVEGPTRSSSSSSRGQIRPRHGRGDPRTARRTCQRHQGPHPDHQADQIADYHRARCGPRSTALADRHRADTAPGYQPTRRRSTTPAAADELALKRLAKRARGCTGPPTRRG